MKTEIKLVVFCKTKTEDNSYDIFEAIELLHDAQIGLLSDSLEINQP